MNNHFTKECISQHPERNQDPQIPWRDSEMGRQWTAKGHKILRTTYLLDGSPWTDYKPVRDLKGLQNGDKPNKRFKKCTDILASITQYNHVTDQISVIIYLTTRSLIFICFLITGQYRVVILVKA